MTYMTRVNDACEERPCTLARTWWGYASRTRDETVSWV